MADVSERTQATFMYTYTYDQFTVFFYGDRVFVGRKEYPIGPTSPSRYSTPTAARAT